MNWLAVLLGSGVTGLLVAILIWLGRNWILERLKQSIKHEYDVKLAEIEAAIRRRDTQLEDLRRSALQAISASQGAFETRRLQAIDELMDGLLQLKKGLSISTSLSVLNFENLSRRIGEPKIQQFVDAAMTGYEETAKVVAAAGSTARVQPFVSPIAWALYSAYSAIISFDLARAAALKNRIPNATEFLVPTRVMELISAALPDMAVELTRAGVTTFEGALREIEKRLIAELRRLVVGGDSDAASLERARAVAQALQCLDADNDRAEIEKVKAKQREIAG